MSYLEIEIDGKIYSAEYILDENVVTVYAEGGSESTQLGGMSEGAVAKMLLRNLIRLGKVASIK